jgi:hypothetical protein
VQNVKEKWVHVSCKPYEQGTRDPYLNARVITKVSQVNLLWRYNCRHRQCTVLFGVAPPQKDRPLPSCRRIPHFSNMYMSRRKNLGQKSRRDLKQRMTVLARVSSNLTDRPTDCRAVQLCDGRLTWVVVSQSRDSVCSWQLEEMVAGLRGREPGSRGASAVGSPCQATLVKDYEV